MTRSTPASIAQRNGAWSIRRSSLAGASIRTAAASVLTSAAPKPGKCLAVAATPPRCRPRTKRVPYTATCAGLVPKPRPSAASAPSGRGTSSTGARSTFMPAARSVAAVALPSASAMAGSPVAAISGGERRGAPGSRFTSARPPGRP